MCCGSGKSLIIAAYMLKLLMSNSKFKIFFFTSKLTLEAQFVKRFGKIFNNFGFKTCRVNCNETCDFEKSVNDNRLFFFLYKSASKIQSAIENKLICPNESYFFLDEAHNANNTAAFLLKTKNFRFSATMKDNENVIFNYS
jgi:hypothetical protein